MLRVINTVIDDQKIVKIFTIKTPQNSNIKKTKGTTDNKFATESVFIILQITENVGSNYFIIAKWYFCNLCLHGIVYILLPMSLSIFH